jgi:D-alanyl-D-alanine dipeptidase
MVLLLSAVHAELPEGFVYIQDVIPNIQLDVRYLSNNNFVGKSVDGYKKSVGILSTQATEALKKAQQLFEKDGYSIVIYDAYRPQKAVDHFVRWSKDLADIVMKKSFYATLEKKNLFKLGYIAKKSGHSRGSTIDLTIIKKGETVSAPTAVKKSDTNNVEWNLLVDNTVNMGSPFDVFDTISHIQSDQITPEQQKMRDYLQSTMQQAGFKGYNEEWWHFTLINEPFPETYFNFDIE